MYERLKQLIADLDAMGIQPFICYGNPDAKILIVGKECAWEEESDDWKKFYKPNFSQWKASFNGHGFGFAHGGQPYDFDHGFHPIHPFYCQCNTLKKNSCKTSNTYYYYQRLVDMIRDNESRKFIDFFKDCFITELNEDCRLSNKGLEKSQRKKTEDNIRMRFDWMRKTNFFNQFKVVILACGPYADAIKEDKVLQKDLFGDAHVCYCHQLSFWDKDLDEEIPKIQQCLKEL